MAPPRKSGGKSGLTVTLTVSPDKLRDIIRLQSAKETGDSKEDTPVHETVESKDEKDTTDTKDEFKESNDSQPSPATSATLPATQTNGENASDSTPASPGDTNGTPAPSAMGPPAEGLKKKGVKRGAAALNGGETKIRGKPGPKKKPRLEDGTIDPNAATGRQSGIGASHKLGPKANQGAINAGLRALDRSGKPCRKWARGGFRLKTFTGVVWEVNRWAAPARLAPDVSNDDSAAASVSSSTKENKDDSHPKSEVNSNSNNEVGGPEVEMQSVPSLNAGSPAPIPVAAAS